MATPNNPGSGNTIVSITPAIEFVCMLNGERFTASITHQEVNSLQFIYHISFSDGHSGVFFADENSNKWIEEGRSRSAYADAITSDMIAFLGLMPKTPPFCMRISNGDEAFNIWIREGRDGVFNVIYKGDFRFYLKKVDGAWQASTVERHNGYINQEICKLVQKKLDSLGK